MSLSSFIKSGIFVRLSIMMFLQFAVWGAWWMNLGIYMEQGRVDMTSKIWLAFLSAPLAAIISPFFLGLIADRFFATERVLGTMHILGGILLAISPTFAEGAMRSETVFILFLMLHMLCYMPTIGLTNTLSFHNIPKQEQFSYVRMFGTIGWIVASGLIVGLWLKAEDQALSLYIGSGLAIALGIYSFTLPHTPPPAAGKEMTAREAVGLDALSRLSSRPFWVFTICSLLICIPLSVYYAFTGPFLSAAGFEEENFMMSFGQMTEVVFLLLMPLGFAYLGTKWVLVVGMLAWAVRYALFAVGAPDTMTWMIMLGILLHGVCFDFFFVAGQIYVDKKAPSDIRGQAQGFIVWVTYGIGMFIGTAVGGWFLFNNIVVSEGQQERLNEFQLFWAIPAVFAAIVMLIFITLFHDPDVDREEEQQLETAEAAEAAANEPAS
jgi:nucleoside transporter